MTLQPLAVLSLILFTSPMYCMKVAYQICEAVKVATQTTAYQTTRFATASTAAVQYAKYIDVNAKFRIQVLTAINHATESIVKSKAYMIPATTLLEVKNQLKIYMREIQSVNFENFTHQCIANQTIKEINDTIQKIDTTIRQSSVATITRGPTAQLLRSITQANDVYPIYRTYSSVQPQPSSALDSSTFIARPTAQVHVASVAKQQVQRRTSFDVVDSGASHRDLPEPQAQHKDPPTKQVGIVSHPTGFIEPNSGNTSAEALFHQLAQLDKHAWQYTTIKNRLNTVAQRIGKYICIGTSLILGYKTLSSPRHDFFVNATFTGIIGLLLYTGIPRIINKIFLSRRTHQVTEQLFSDDQAITRKLQAIRRNTPAEKVRRKIQERLTQLNTEHHLQSERFRQKYAETLAYLR